MSDKLRWPTFWALVGVFLVIVCLFLIPSFREFLSGSLWFLAPLAVFFLLGVALIVFTLRGKVEGRLRKFFLLTGASSAGFFLFVLLHNAFYALNVVSDHIPVIGLLTEFLHAAFFFLAIPICPLGFLVGVVGVIVIGARRLKTPLTPRLDT